MKILLFLLLLLPLGLDVKAQVVLNGSNYNDLNEWRFYSDHFFIRKNDCGEQTDLIHICEKGFWSAPYKSGTFDLSASFVIPRDSLRFLFDCRGRQVDSLLLKVNLYKDNEEFLSQLVWPLKINGSNSITFMNTDARIMDVQICGKSMMKYDSIFLRITGFNMHTFQTELPEVQKAGKSSISLADVVPLSLACDLDEFRCRKIIGLGESVHGSMGINQEKYNMIGKLCEDRNVKLVCLEVSIDQAMNWDLYIQGVLPEDYQIQIAEEVKGSFSEAELVVELLKRLRAINRGRKPEDRVHMVGLDLRNEKYFVFEYLQAYRKKVRNREFLTDVLLRLDSLEYPQLGAKQLSILATGARKMPPLVRIEWNEIPSGKKFSNLAGAVEENSKLMKLMGERNFRFFREGILLNLPTFHDMSRSDSVEDGRDEYMWQIFQLATACYAPGKSDRVIVVAHSLHLSHTCNPYSRDSLLARKNLGVYISEAYGRDFWNVSFHVGKGSYKTNVSGRVDKHNLQMPPPGSFEQIAGRSALLGNFYCRSLGLQEVTSFRSIANIPESNQFYSLSKRRFDSYVYIDKSGACYPVSHDKRPHYRRRVEMSRYLALLRLTHKSYQPFNYRVFVDTVSNLEVRESSVFGWIDDYTRLVSEENQNNLGMYYGFFEARDKNCIVIIDNMVVPMRFPRFPAPRRTIEVEAVRNCLRAPLCLKELRVEEEKTFRGEIEALAGKYLTYGSGEYARQAFNADRIAEISLKIEPTDRIHFLGSYRYGEAILIEKGGATLNLKCFYTEKGFRNREKYRRAVESLIRFK